MSSSWSWSTFLDLSQHVVSFWLFLLCLSFLVMSCLLPLHHVERVHHVMSRQWRFRIWHQPLSCDSCRHVVGFFILGGCCQLRLELDTSRIVGNHVIKMCPSSSTCPWFACRSLFPFSVVFTFFCNLEFSRLMTWISSLWRCLSLRRCHPCLVVRVALHVVY